MGQGSSQSNATWKASTETAFTELKVFVGTWNLGDAEPNNLSAFIPKTGYDVYFIGTQESHYSHTGDCDSDEEDEKQAQSETAPPPRHESFEDFHVKRVLTARSRTIHDETIKATARRDSAMQDHQNYKKDLWYARLTSHLGPDYMCNAFEVMGKIKSALFCHRDHLPYFRNLLVAHVPTGILGTGTNKGGIGFSIAYGHTRMCFVNAHFAAHQDMCEKRDSDFRKIVHFLSTQFEEALPRYGLSLLNQHHVVFWTGDLNYRCNFGEQSTRNPFHPYNLRS